MKDKSLKGKTLRYKTNTSFFQIPEMPRRIKSFHHLSSSLLLVTLLVHSSMSYTWVDTVNHPIYYRRFGFPSRPLKHGPTPKFDKDVQDRIRAFVDPFYTPTTPSWEDVKPYLRDKGIDYPDIRAFHPNIIGWGWSLHQGTLQQASILGWREKVLLKYMVMSWFLSVLSNRMIFFSWNLQCNTHASHSSLSYRMRMMYCNIQQAFLPS